MSGIVRSNPYLAMALQSQVNGHSQMMERSILGSQTVNGVLNYYEMVIDLANIARGS
jgi:hypothetical protein